MELKSLFAAAIALLVADPALASSRFYCAADDDAIKLSIESNFSEGFGQKLIHFRGILVLKDEAAPAEYRILHLKSDMLSQYWIDAQSLQMRIFTETKQEKPYASLDMSILTSVVSGKPDLLEGEYRLEVSGAENRKLTPETQISRTGRLSCNYN